MNELEALRQENIRLKRELSITRAKDELIRQRGRNYEKTDTPMAYSGALRSVFEGLAAAQCEVYGSGGQYTAQCPAHDDRGPSLRIKECPDGAVLLYCHAGCHIMDIVRALGVEWADLGRQGFVRPLPGKAA